MSFQEKPEGQTHSYFQSWEEVEKKWEKAPPWLKRKIPDMVDFLHLVWLSAADKTIDLCIKEIPKTIPSIEVQQEKEIAQGYVIAINTITDRLNKLKEKE